MFNIGKKQYRIELFPDGSNKALKTIMSNAKSSGASVFWNPIMRLGCKPPKGYDVIFLEGTVKNFIRYYTNDLKKGRVSIFEYVKIIKSLF